MVDLTGKDKGNISLPPRLQSPDIEEENPNQEKRVTIINMQKALYEVKIEDLQKRITRLEDRNKSLIDEYTSTDLEYHLKNAETADKILEINREISQELNKIKTDKEESQMIEKLRFENKEEHEKNAEMMQKYYEKTRLDLVSKLKILNARINTLEDFKKTKENLSEKLSRNNDILMENEKKFQRDLYQIGQKFKFATEKIKSDLYDRLLELNQDFQLEMLQNLSPDFHRLIRENIAIRNDCIQLSNENIVKEENTNEIKYTSEMYRHKLKKNQKQTINQIIISKAQSNLISSLKSQHTRLNKLMKNLKKTDDSEDFEKQFFEKIKVDENLDFKKRNLEVILHQTKVKLNFTLNNQKCSRNMMKKLKHILYDVKLIVLCALKISRSDEEIDKMTYKQLLLFLMNKIIENKSETSVESIDSVETIMPVDIVSKLEDLGFEPTELKLDETSFKENKASLQNEIKETFEFKALTPEIIKVDFEEKEGSVKSVEYLESFNYQKMWELEENELTENSEEEISETFSGNEIIELEERDVEENLN